MGFLNPANDFRWILPTETDADSPVNEELMSQYRENIEGNTMNRIYTNRRAKVVTRDSDTQLTIEKIDNNDLDWDDGVSSGLQIVFKTGIALGITYRAQNNTELLDTPDTATLTTTDSFATGIGAGDELLIMYVQTGYAHTHDGVDSAPLGAENMINFHSTGAFRIINSDYVLNSDGSGKTGVIVNRTEALNKVFGYIRLVFPSGSSTLYNGAVFRVRLLAGNYYYFDAQGTFQNYTLASNVDGPSMTLSGIPVLNADNELTVNLGRALYSVDLSSAGVPLGAPVKATLIGRRTTGDPDIGNVLSTASYMFTSA